MEKEGVEFELTAAQQHRSMNVSIVAAVLSVIAAWSFGGNVLTLVCLKLGASEMFLGLLSFAAVAPFACGIFTMSAIERVGKRKILTIWHSIAIIFLVPFLLLPIMVEHFFK